ncbi:autotransporter domain-containing protein [Reyranella sp. MMS21-HV4-11]|uniref:Autotransporter domain-containing protein n=1 Tax=Reyranella humidisoli TaxID=2849149 RepID=A0ABS6IUE1_9HYPH|nr:autotransporter outer membrane beta-barrel domain-containing protein [Reyranella sp. MMS21-HV4-11]MBU8877307.1 autotransporter domain-containing protein [Reyranella sp. MMS21-HV4-11]
MVAVFVGAAGLGALTRPAQAQLGFKTYQYGTSAITTVTGIRGDNMTGNYSYAGGTGGLLFGLSGDSISPFPSAAVGASNYPGATSSTPYGPSFGSASGILRVVGSYITAASNPYDLGYLYDAAKAPGSQLSTLIYPGGDTLYTIAHSNFGNQVVGNYDTRFATGNAFVYDIPTGTFTTNNKPGAVSTTAYGVYGNRIAGGFADPTLHGYIYNQSTRGFTTYDAPGGVVTHFEGITSGGRANTYNLVADSVDINGNPHAWAVHVDAAGIATWTEIAVPGASVTSANSTYGGYVIGVYVENGVTRAYTVNVPGLYNPVTNSANVISGVAGAVAIDGAGDDVVNSGSIQMSGANAIGIGNGTYGVVTNYGTIGVTGGGGTAVQMRGEFGSLLNAGTISATPGGYAIRADGTAVGSLVVNNGTIDGLVSIAAGPDARFENSGWLGIAGAGAGATHQTSGTFVQTSAGTMGLRVSPTAADKLVVNGTARLAGGLQVLAQGGTFGPRSTYTLVTATGGLSGAFQTVASTSPFLIPTLSYDANNAYLDLQVGGFAQAALTPNQAAVGAVLDATAPTATGDYATVVSALAGLSAQQGQAVMNSISGQNYSGFSNSMVQGIQLFLGNFAGQAGGSGSSGGSSRVALAEACDVACDSTVPALWSAWGGALGGLGTISNGGANAGALTYSVGGFAAGLDRLVAANLRVGATIGYQNASQWVAGFSGNGSSNTFQVGLYANYSQDKVYADVIAGYAYSANQMWRSIAIPGLAPRTAIGNTGANQFYGQVETGYRFDLGGLADAFVTPFVRLQAYTGTQNAFTETGAGSLNLSVAQQTTNSLRTVLGAQLGGSMDLGWRDRLALKVRLGWSHEYADTARPVTASFAGAPVAPFTTYGVAPQRDGVVMGLAANTAIADATSIYLRYEGEVSGQDNAHAFTAGFRMTW